MAATATDELVDVIEHAVITGLDDLLRARGEVAPPTVHMLIDGDDPAYLGCVICRPFYPGEDAYKAIGRLGHIPAAVEATRLLLAWEAQDLNAALRQPVDPDATALVVVDATLHGGEVLHWYPLRMRRARHGQPGVLADWEPALTRIDPPLPEPIVRALVLWRHARGGNIDTQVADLTADGYRIAWSGGQ